MPISAVPEVKPASVAVECNVKTNAAIVFSTARGRNARQDSASAGIIGMTVGALIGSGEESSGKKLFESKIGIDKDLEVRLVNDAIQSRLRRNALLATNETEQVKLFVRLDAIGLQETQKGYWTPFLEVNAKLMKSGGSIWETSVSSTGLRSRQVSEFTTDPKLYQADLQDAIDDVAKQLVDGPIRR